MKFQYTTYNENDDELTVICRYEKEQKETLVDPFLDDDIEVEEVLLDNKDIYDTLSEEEIQAFKNGAWSEIECGVFDDERY